MNSWEIQFVNTATRYDAVESETSMRSSRVLVPPAFRYRRALLPDCFAIHFATGTAERARGNAKAHPAKLQFGGVIARNFTDGHVVHAAFEQRHIFELVRRCGVGAEFC